MSYNPVAVNNSDDRSSKKVEEIRVNVYLTLLGWCQLCCILSGGGGAGGKQGPESEEGLIPWSTDNERPPRLHTTIG